MARGKIKKEQIDTEGAGNIATDIEVGQMISGSFAQFEWQSPVIAKQNTPPESPAVGDRYIVGTSPGGAWYEHDNEITYYDGSAWQFNVPSAGWICWIMDVGAIFFYKYFNGKFWHLLGMIDGNLYVNYDGPPPNGKGYVYFYSGGSPTGQRLEWDPNALLYPGGAFFLSGHCEIGGDLNIVGNVDCQGNILVRWQGGEGDSFVYFYDGGVATSKYLKWADANDRFEFNDDLYVAGNIIASGSIGGGIFCKGGTLYKSDGIANAALNIIVWRAPFACTVTNVRGYRVGGTGATINARLNGSSNHLASALSLTSADTWMDGGAVQNIAFAAGDKLEIMVVSTAGTVTQLAIQIDFTKP